MPKPTPYQISYSFSGFQAANPDRPLPAQRVDIELQNLQLTTDEIIAALAEVRRSDGKLFNGVVDLAALSDEVIQRLGGGGTGGSGSGNLIFATKAQAESGTSNAVVMSPLRVKEAIAALAGVGGGGATDPLLTIHLADRGNPHQTTKEQVGLGSVNNTADSQKPVSQAQGQAIATAREAAITAITNRIGAQNGIAPLGPDGLVPAQYGRPEWIGGEGGGGGYDYTPEDVAQKNQPTGYAGLDGQARLFRDQQGFNPDPIGRPDIFVPLYQRLGQEVVLTDGYVDGSGLTDFSDLIEANLARAAVQRRPFVIPAGKFAASRKFAASGVPISIFGCGMTMSAIEWADGASSSGFDFAFDSDDDFAHFEDFGLYTKQFNQGTALRVSFAGKILDNSGNPVVWSRFQPCGRARGLLIRGTDGTLSNGFSRAIEVDAPLGFNIQECHAWGAATGSNTATNASELAFYLGKANGYGHPVECLVQNNRVFRFKKALMFEGMEGCFAHFNNFVGVGIGIHFKDSAGRPHLDASHNHCNVSEAGIFVESGSQLFLESNLIYHVIDATTPGYGIVVSGDSQHANIRGNQFESAIGSSQEFQAITIIKCDHGAIDHNTFRPAVQQSGQSVNMKGITLGSDARFFKVGANNVFEDTRSGRPGVIYESRDGGVSNKIPNTGARYRVSSTQYFGGSDGTLLFDGDVEDRFGASTPTYMGGGFVVPTDGVWQFTCRARWTSASPTGGRVLRLRRNGVQFDSAFDVGNGVSNLIQALNPAIVRCRRGETITISAFADQGGYINANNDTFFEARLIN